jgi:hypothetical protein
MTNHQIAKNNMYKLMGDQLSLIIVNPYKYGLGREKKVGQVTHIAPLQPSAFAAFPPWRIEQELIV